MDINDPYDDPGYYDFIYGMLLGSQGGGRCIPRFEPEYHFTKQGEMCYVLFRPNRLMDRNGKYVRKFWWGGYVLVDSIKQATVWKDFDEAAEWAKKHRLN